MEFDEDDNYYLELSKDAVRFEPVSKVTNVFFDDTNRQVLSIDRMSKNCAFDGSWNESER